MIPYFFTSTFYFNLLGSFVTAFLLSFILGKPVIRWLCAWQSKQPVRAYVPKEHLKKTGTPTFGGILIIFVIMITMLLWNELQEITFILLTTLLGFSIIGGLDDLSKIFYKEKPGLSIRHKYLLQTLLGLGLSYWLYKTQTTYPSISLGWWSLPIGSLFIPWVYFIVVGSSNAWNLTDGLDGLAISQTMIIACSIIILALLPNAKGLSCIAQLVSISAMAILGSSLGFLWFNAHPAQVFMGDIGSLGLGATLAMMAILLKKEWWFAFMALIPVAETLSVIWQILFFKWTKKRYFLLAPFHHHLELKGWKETKIVARFSIVTAFVCIISILYHLPS